ncbi:hypothetical protein ILYODFUR_020315 [Ilyodon furcidens]|uniref:Uncharacterized protein n=1 Tax=Ilyodon furcidens TaxID=33524 RepID=A0ABV0V6W0_9TELE
MTPTKTFSCLLVPRPISERHSVHVTCGPDSVSVGPAQEQRPKFFVTVFIFGIIFFLSRGFGLMIAATISAGNTDRVGHAGLDLWDVNLCSHILLCSSRAVCVNFKTSIIRMSAGFHPVCLLLKSQKVHLTQTYLFLVKRLQFKCLDLFSTDLTFKHPVRKRTETPFFTLKFEGSLHV